MEVFAYAGNEVIRDSSWKSSFHASLARVKTPIPFEDSISSRLMVDQFAAISIFVFHAMFDRLRHELRSNYRRIKRRSFVRYPLSFKFPGTDEIEQKRLSFSLFRLKFLYFQGSRVPICYNILPEY